MKVVVVAVLLNYDTSLQQHNAPHHHSFLPYSMLEGPRHELLYELHHPTINSSYFKYCPPNIGESEEDFLVVEVLVGATLGVNNRHVPPGGYFKAPSYNASPNVADSLAKPRSLAIAMIILSQTYYIVMTNLGSANYMEKDKAPVYICLLFITHV